MTQELRTLAAVSGDPRFLPSTCTRLPVTNVLRDPTSSSRFCGYSCTWYIYTLSGKYKEKINKYLKWSMYWVGFKARLFSIRNYKSMKRANFFSSQRGLSTSQVYYCQSDFEGPPVPSYLQGSCFSTSSHFWLLNWIRRGRGSGVLLWNIFLLHGLNFGFHIQPTHISDEKEGCCDMMQTEIPATSRYDQGSSPDKTYLCSLLGL